MLSLRHLYRIGHGPSSSHTMAPRRAAELFKMRNPHAAAFRVTLFDSLAATGRGHLTDVVLLGELQPLPVEIVWKPDERLPLHQNGMQFEAFNARGDRTDFWQVYSWGGGAFGETRDGPDLQPVYDLKSMTDIMLRCETQGQAYWEYVLEREDEEIWSYLGEIWSVMIAAIQRGLETEGVLPGGLGVPRKASSFFKRADLDGPEVRRRGLLSAYALAVSEENASGGLVVTAPTCGACGILPAVLLYLKERIGSTEESVLRALATAGLVGNLVKHNASISGAEVGCQGEVGVACAMAAAAATQMLGGSIRQIEYAASMAIEHNLGLTCDPVDGLVQIPCIERNAFAAAQALSCADYTLFTDGNHLIAFDDVVAVMWETGNNLPSLYRETSSGGLAKMFSRRRDEQSDT